MFQIPNVEPVSDAESCVALEAFSRIEEGIIDGNLRFAFLLADLRRNCGHRPDVGRTAA